MKNYLKGFTLIELLVVISIIALLSSVVMSSVIKARIRARDTARLQNARQIAIALEQYESTFNTYKVANSGLTGNNGSGYVAKSGGSYGTSILSALKSSGLYSNPNLTDSVFGDNYYLGLCTSTNAYNVFVKLEQPQYNNSTTSISNTCGGTEAAAAGFNFIASTAGGSSGGGGGTSGFGGAYEYGMSAPVASACGGVASIVGPDSIAYGTVTAEDNKCWLDRNLGATQVATAYNDSAAYGHYYQWGRGIDGHQIKTSPTTAVTSSSDTPGHGSFITTTSNPHDWRNPSNTSLWSGLNGVNNPCPSGFRLPTSLEWSTLVAAAGLVKPASSVYNSTLKLPAAGVRYNDTATIAFAGNEGYYWSSYSSSNMFNFNSFGVYPTATSRNSLGASVRCIKN